VLHPVVPMDSSCECEDNNPDSLDARLFPSVVLAVAPAVTMDEASSLSRIYGIGAGDVVFTFTRGSCRCRCSRRWAWCVFLVAEQ